jgi:hypothetical protein
MRVPDFFARNVRLFAACVAKSKRAASTTPTTREEVRPIRVARALQCSRRMRISRAIFLVMMSGCAAPVRYVDRPILWHDPDDAPIKMPAHQEAGIQWTGFRDAVIFPAERALTLDYGEEAWNANALDDAPDSSWFVDVRRAHLDDEHRGERPRHFSVEEITRGPWGDDPGPIAPFTIIKGKTIGSTPGLVIEDAKKHRYMFKLDPPDWRGMNTSTEVVAARLAWASGWLVPAEMIVDVRVEDLILSPNAHGKNEWDEEIPITPQMLSELLARTPHGSDGTIRVCAGRWITGRNLGSFAYMGTRSGDANDRIPHQNRRDVRGFGVFAAWVNDIDTMENNTMDAYVGTDGHGHILHYQQDVGGSFGQFAAVPATVWMGDETFFMPGRIFASLFTFGFTSRNWEGEAREARRERSMREYHELGYFDDEGFNPRDWHPVLDNPAFVRATARDRYWGAKRIAAFDEEELRAAIALGRYEPKTAERLFTILWNRREKILRAFFSDVAPLDYFHFEGQQLCYDDLWNQSAQCIAAEVSPGYHVAALHALGHQVRVHYVAADGRAHVIGVER